MKKLVIALLAASALSLAASAASAECFGHNDVTAGNEETRESVAMSTYDGDVTVPTSEQAREKAEAQATTSPCKEGEKDCTPATE